MRMSATVDVLSARACPSLFVLTFRFLVAILTLLRFRLDSTMWLSVFLIIGMMISLARQSMPIAVQLETALTKDRLATMDVTKKEMFQMFALGLAGSRALSLLSSLGGASKPQVVYDALGLVGGINLVGIFLVETKTLLRTLDNHREQAD